LLKLALIKSSACSGRIGQTSYLTAGDTLAIVDPTTGLGCNTAVQTVLDFNNYIAGLNANQNVDFLLQSYNARSNQVISLNHDESIRMRRVYRPDALQPSAGIPVRA
jgi:hypothetical protein